jgi:hypothetical protein
MPSDGAWSIMMTRHVDAYSLRQAEVKQFLFDWAAVAAKGRGIDLDPNGRPAISDRHPVVIFRHPSRSDDTRTLIASALPSEGYMYNKGYVHAVAHEAGTSEDALLALLGLLGSNIEDWWARRFVDRHVTAPVVNNLPLPGLDDEAIREIAGHVALVLVDSGYSELAGGIDVSRRAARAPDSEATSEFHLAMINALVAFGHGLTSADLSTIRSDFSGAGWPESAFEQACKRLDDLHKETNE